MTAIFIFISGATLLIYSAEKLIGYLVGAGSRLMISVFLLAVIFTGIEFDDIALGVALNLEGLGQVALGIVLGTAISFSGIVLALAAILCPSEVHVRRDYLVIFAAAPLVMAIFVLAAPLSVLDGGILLGLFALFVVYIAVRERSRKTPTFQNAEVYDELISAEASTADVVAPTDGDGNELPFAGTRRMPGWANLGLAVLALAGLIIGAATTSTGIEGILDGYGLDGTVFGATIATAALTIEDLFLTVEPVRRGVPAIGIGNVIGSLVFSVTGKLGVIILAGGGIVVGLDVFRWHLPALVVVTACAAYFLSTGRLRRWHGYTLLGMYVAYWVVSFVLFQTTPIEMD